MARPVEVGGAFLLLAVLLSIMRLLFSSARTLPALSSGSIVDQSADAAALIEELRLLRSDIGKLQLVLQDGRVPQTAARSTVALLEPSSTAPAVPTPAPTLGKRDGAVLMAVITNPSHIQERAELRAFYKQAFPSEREKMRVVFVMGNNYFLGNPPKPLSSETKALLKEVMGESKREGDIVWVDGREALPHVGKATEKSAAWWQTAPSLGNYGFYCKSDDDSLIHLR